LSALVGHAFMCRCLHLAARPLPLQGPAAATDLCLHPATAATEQAFAAAA
jgi:hypothetical protein